MGKARLESPGRCGRTQRPVRPGQLCRRGGPPRGLLRACGDCQDPFAVPDDPVEAALSEWIEARGGNPFMEIAVPDASLRLIQACGRLLRTEEDRGTISVLDRRLVTQRYGKAILDALPPFRREIG